MVNDAMEPRVSGGVRDSAADRVPESAEAGALSGKSFAELNTLARIANEEALASSGRPSDSFLLDRLEPRILGGLLYLLMASVAYEGELLDVCAFDQPGVEEGKQFTYGLMGRTGFEHKAEEFRRITSRRGA